MESLGKVFDKIAGKVRSEDQENKDRDSATYNGTIANEGRSIPKYTDFAASRGVIKDKIYLKASVLSSLEQLDEIRKEVRAGNIMIVRFRPLAEKNINDVRLVVNDLAKFVEEIKGDIARLGEERVVVTPPSVRVWREKDNRKSNVTAVE